MIPIWNSRIACNDGGSIVCSLWAFSADFRVSWVSPLSWHSAILKTPAPHPSLVSDHISSTSGLDKVAHVSHVPGSAALDGQVSHSRLLSRPWPCLKRLGTGLSAISFGRLSCLAHSAMDGGGRRRFGGVASTSRFCGQPLLFGPCFGFCGTTIMVVLARMSESARAGSAAVPNELSFATIMK